MTDQPPAGRFSGLRIGFSTANGPEPAGRRMFETNSRHCMAGRHSAEQVVAERDQTDAHQEQPAAIRVTGSRHQATARLMLF
jgi:hypothetical protein